MTDEHFDRHSSIVQYEVTGCAAHSRISPLLPDKWVDAKSSRPEQKEDSIVTDFLWENAPRRETQPYRDYVKCYSHLPNGTAILDSKWVLARLLGCVHRDSSQASDKQHLATLETYCFRGVSGFRSFLDREASSKDSAKRYHPSHNFDLLDRVPHPPSDIDEQESPGLWVVKDASSNGAGGVWVVGNENYDQFCDNTASPLIEEHRYVAQRYAWPLVLYGGRKCHVRVYGLLTSDGRAFVHRRAFLHVANDPFTASAGETKRNEYQPSVHITNCCANSDDPSKFAGEILADLQSTESRVSKESGETVVALGSFWESISASVAELARRTSPFLQGGEANNGFEYLGMDFILSYSDGKPVAYLLEVNAPPAQDTATGLSYAEELHDTVIRDIFSLWIFPKVNEFGPEVPGGWRCVYKEPKRELVKESKFIAPSKAAILNKIRWALYEQKISRRQEDGPPPEFRDDEISFRRSSISSAQLVAAISAYARSYFPYFDDKGGSQSQASQQKAFFENAGGSQVPVQVINAVCSSLRCRNRSVIGYSTQAAAKDVLRTLLGATHHDIFLGANATSLLSILAAQYTRSGFLKKSDEIVISSENHLANVKPWVQAASTVGATVKWWNPSAAPIEEVLSSRTRLVAVPHCSNILGQIIDVISIRKAVDQVTLGAAHVIVDGVTAVPHCFAAVDEMDVEWYVVSCHKLFGPHLGALCGRSSAVEKIVFKGEKPTDVLEIGTVSYEACAGIQGLGEYFGQLSMYSSDRCNQSSFTENEQKARQTSNQSSSEGILRKSRNEAIEESTALRLTTAGVKEAYRLIRLVETPLVDLLLTCLERSTKVRVIENSGVKLVSRLPIVSFRHAEIPSSTIVEICNKAGVVCRCGTFLCTGLLQNDYDFDYTNDILRFSFAHYNCSYEVQYAIQVLESLPGWF